VRFVAMKIYLLQRYCGVRASVSKPNFFFWKLNCVYLYKMTCHFLVLSSTNVFLEMIRNAINI
jgi:hypothetical protein